MSERPPENDPLAPLSKRERMIAERFAEGLTYRQIGKALCIAPATVRTHIAAIYRKLEIGSKAALVRVYADHRHAARQTTEAGGPGPPHVESSPKTVPGRRQITVLVGGFQGFLRLSRGLDPEDLSRRLAGYERVLRAVATRYDGHSTGLGGGSIRIYFGYPAAHEDDAERAVRCGLALILEVAEHSARCDAPLRLAVGVATGQIVVEDVNVDHSHPEKAIIGAAPHLAAYLRDKAGADALLVAASTKSLLGQAFNLEEIPTPEAVAFRILSERKTASRFEARSGASLLPMVGREQELALLLERWAQAKAGEGQGVLLVGEAGIGKSHCPRAARCDRRRASHPDPLPVLALSCR